MDLFKRVDRRKLKLKSSLVISAYDFDDLRRDRHVGIVLLSRLAIRSVLLRHKFADSCKVRCFCNDLRAPPCDVFIAVTRSKDRWFVEGDATNVVNQSCIFELRDLIRMHAELPPDCHREIGGRFEWPRGARPATSGICANARIVWPYVTRVLSYRTNAVWLNAYGNTVTGTAHQRITGHAKPKRAPAISIVTIADQSSSARSQRKRTDRSSLSSLSSPTNDRNKARVAYQMTPAVMSANRLSHSSLTESESIASVVR